MCVASTIVEIIEELNPSFKTLDEAERLEYYNSLTDKQRYKINITTLKRIGKGQNKILCYEPDRMDSNQKLLEYKNILEFDQEGRELHKQHQLKYIKTHPISEEISNEERLVLEKSFKSVQLDLPGEWFRFIENDKLVYSEIQSLRAYLRDTIDDTLEDLIAEYLSIDLPENMDDNDTISISLPNVSSSNIQESVRAEVAQYELNELPTVVNQLLDGKCLFNKGFRLDDFEDLDEPFSLFIFCELNSAKSVTFENFVEDFKKIEQPREILDEISQKFQEKVEKDLRAIISRVRYR
ncbi:MAG: hypothetical protein COB02_13995 [Candidatus Cloacimonadota bacterium]|nr:MAG: hypothetical protein COB02_13995 [Candidatus Cloacimonadota bacterium]